MKRELLDPEERLKNKRKADKEKRLDERKRDTGL